MSNRNNEDTNDMFNDKGNTLREFCIQNRLYIMKQKDKRGDVQKNKQSTHFLYSGERGGVLGVPDLMMKTFLTKYATDVKSKDAKRKHHMSENRSEVFSLYFDLDRREKFKIQPEDYIPHAKTIIRTMKKFYTGTKKKEIYYCVIEVSNENEELQLPTEENNGQTETWYKRGAHIKFKYCSVNTHQAKLIRESLLAELILEFGDRPTHVKKNSWSDVVDRGVYEHNGCRMAFSLKMDKCPVCKGRSESKTKGVCSNCRRGNKINEETMICSNCNAKVDEVPTKESCSHCEMTGKIEKDKYYVPTLALDHNGDIDEMRTKLLKDNILYAIIGSSIRKPADTKITDGFVVYDGAPLYVELERKKKSGGKVDLNNLFPQEAKLMGRTKNKVYVNSGDARFKAIETMIRTRVTDDKFKRVLGHILYHNPKMTEYSMLLQGDEAHYCMQRQGYHENNRAFFKVDPKKGMRQVCYDEECASQGGVGSRYESTPIPLSRETKSLLFGNQKVTMTGAAELKKQSLELEEATTGDQMIKNAEQMLAYYESACFDAKPLQSEVNNKKYRRKVDNATKKNGKRKANADDNDEDDTEKIQHGKANKRVKTN
jgi:hypothetical protein